MTTRIEAIRTEGLGDTTYVLIHDGQAVVIDPQRDIDRFERVIDDAHSEARLVIETHLHNDYVSGGRDLATSLDAELLMPAGAAPVFRHSPAFHHEDIDLGVMTIRPIHTPGHTPEHMSYVVLIDGREMAVFSGGSLLVGSAGRCDLLGDDRADSLARLQYRSVHRLASLPGPTELYPTHGAGSFCTTTQAASYSSTIESEIANNPVLAYEDEDSFVKGELSGLVRYPTYYRHMGPINLTGRDQPDLDVQILDRVPEGTTVIDARPRVDYAKGHLPGSLSIELGDSFGTWVGWLTEFDSPLTLVLNEDQDQDDAIRHLIRIGYDNVRGIVRPNEDFSESFRTVDTDAFADAVASGAQVLDVRAQHEWESGTIEGSTLTYLPDLDPRSMGVLDPEEPVWVLCASGYRAVAAASMLHNMGYEPVALSSDGATEVLAATSKRS